MYNNLDEKLKETNEFLNKAYDLIADRIMDKFPLEDPKLLFRGSDLEDKITEEDAEIMKKATLRPIAKTYVVGMLRAVIHYDCKNLALNENKLDSIWQNACGTKEFYERIGLDQIDGQSVLRRVKQAFLEDLFDTPVDLYADGNVYNITRTGKTLKVIKKE